MPTKQETLENIVPTTNYLGSFVRKMITEISEGKNPPEYFKRGDVIKVMSTNCKKMRPSVIIKVRPEYVVSINLTTQENFHNLCESKSRFFRNGFFCNSYTVTPIDLAKEMYIGTYDNMKVLNNAVKELRQFISKNI